MKYIDADLLRKEIERRREANKRQYHSSAGGTSWQRMCGEEDCLVDLLSFLNTLSEEPDKSLEEAAYKYSFDSRPSIYGQVDVIDAFKTGAEWQKEQGYISKETVKKIARGSLGVQDFIRKIDKYEEDK